MLWGWRKLGALQCSALKVEERDKRQGLWIIFSQLGCWGISCMPYSIEDLCLKLWCTLLRYLLGLEMRYPRLPFWRSSIE